MRRIVLSGLLYLLLTASGCDQAPQQVSRECTTFEGCTTLSGLSSVRDEPFVATDALVHDSTLYVAITSMTRRFDGEVFDPDDIFVLSRPVGLNSEPPDSNWTMQRLTNDPTTRFGGYEGRGSLAVDNSGELRYVWGELVPYDSTETRSPVDRVWMSSLLGGSWSSPKVIADLEPKPIRSLVGSALSGGLVSTSTGLFLLYRGPGTDAFGDARGLRMTGSGWTKDILFDANLVQPSAALGPAGEIVTAFVEVGNSGDDKPEGILFRKSSDGGSSWLPPVEVKRGGAVPSDTFIKTTEPQIVVAAEGDYHILFATDTPPTDIGGDQVWHSMSRDGGMTWTQPRPVNRGDSGYVSRIAATVTPDGNVHVVYSRNPRFGSPSARVRHSVWEDGSWTEQPDLSTKPIQSDRVIGISIASASSGCVHAVWDEITDWDAKISRFRYEQRGC